MEEKQYEERVFYYDDGGVEVIVKRPLIPSREALKSLYDTCNRLFEGNEEVFYKIGECKANKNMKAI